MDDGVSSMYGGEFGSIFDMGGYGSGMINLNSSVSAADLAANPWAGVFEVPRGKEYLYNNMALADGITITNPARVLSDKGDCEVEIFYANGKKHIRKVKKPKFLQKKLTLDEALESADKMFIYLKQYNKKKDDKFEEAELKAYNDAADDFAIMGTTT